MGKGCWRRNAGILLAAALLLWGLPAAAAGQTAGDFTAGGTGTLEDPYRIESAEQLAALASWVNEEGQTGTGQYFRLEQDLTLSGRWTPIGNGKQAFSGHFDGQGHTISGLTMNGAEDYCGLFGKIKGGSVQDVIIQECDIAQRQYVGAIAGMITDASLSGCSTVGGKVNGSSMVGGIVGCMTGKSKVDGCENAAVNRSMLNNIGGIAGYIKDAGVVFDCCNQGDISGKENVGGLVGASGLKSNISIQNCYNKGTVTASVAGEGAALLGRTSQIAPLAYCYYDESCSERAFIAGDAANITQISAIDENGKLLTPIKLAEKSYDEVTIALNAWVDEKEETYRHWQADGLCARYWVSFKDETGEVLSRVWGEAGRLLKEPVEKPVKKGYSFAGWSADDETPWQFDEDVITAPLVLTPLWSPEQISVAPAEIMIAGQVGQQGSLYDLTSLQISHDSDGQKQYRLQTGQRLPQGLRLTAEGLLIGPPSEAVQDQAVILVVTGANGTEATVTLHVTILPLETEKYRIRTQTGAGGVIVPEEVWLAAGQQQTFTIKAEPGYAVEAVLLDGQSLGAVSQYTFKDVRAEHCLTARFVWRGMADESGDGGYDQYEPEARDQAPLIPAREIPAKEEHDPGGGYADTTEHWAAEAIAYVSSKGLMKGTAPGIFGPEETVDRSTLAVIFWRMAGEPSTEAEAAFQDVSQEKWYAQAVAWAAEQGIMTGRSADDFAPEAALSRQELAVLLYRVSGEGSRIADEMLQQYSDSEQTAPWAREAMNWAVANALLVGRSPEYLEPQESLTRAELAVVLMRYGEWTDDIAAK